MLEAEMDTHMDYGKHEMRTKPQENTVALDCLGEFEPLVCRKHQSHVSGIGEQFIALYAKGITNRQIQLHLG